jgi:hypothetical protein
MARVCADEWFENNGQAVLTAALWLARDIPPEERQTKIVVLEGSVDQPNLRTLHLDAPSRGAPARGSGLPELVPDESQRILVMSVEVDGDFCENTRGFLSVTSGRPGRFTKRFGGAVPTRASRAILRLGEKVTLRFGATEVIMSE